MQPTTTNWIEDTLSEREDFNRRTFIKVVTMAAASVGLSSAAATKPPTPRPKPKRAATSNTS